jgi:hypothetical protein
MSQPRAPKSGQISCYIMERTQFYTYLTKSAHVTPIEYWDQFFESCYDTDIWRKFLLDVRRTHYFRISSVLGFLLLVSREGYFIT